MLFPNPCCDQVLFAVAVPTVKDRIVQMATEIEEKATEKFILNMYTKGYTLDQIADVAETSVEVVKAIIKKKEPEMA